MQVARLESEIDFDGWRTAARALRAEGVRPEAVVWTVERELFDQGLFPPHEGEGKAFGVPAAFVELARTVILHRSPSGSPCSIACCGGCGTITTCSISPPTLM